MCATKYQNGELKETYFVDEVETQLREKPLWGSQTQDIHYSEDKTISVECLHSKPLNC
jgi:hypothetical protein